MINQIRVVINRINKEERDGEYEGTKEFEAFNKAMDYFRNVEAFKYTKGPLIIIETEEAMGERLEEISGTLIENLFRFIDVAI